MVTKNPRLNVVLEPTLFDEVKTLAKRERVSLSLKARDLIKEAVEVHEDRYFQKMAEERDKTFSTKKALTHSKIWK